MLKRIEVKNFKSLKHIDFKCAGLNLLMGLNGAGKSSFAQMIRFLSKVADKEHPLERTEMISGRFDDMCYCYGDDKMPIEVAVDFVSVFASDPEVSHTIRRMFVRGKEKDEMLMVNPETYAIDEKISQEVNQELEKMLEKESQCDDWRMLVSDDQELTTKIEEKEEFVESAKKNIEDKESLAFKSYQDLWRRMKYVSSFREKPHAVYDGSRREEYRHFGALPICPDGSDLCEFLLKHARDKVGGIGLEKKTQMLYPGSWRIEEIKDEDRGIIKYVHGNELPRQLQLWLNEVSPGARIFTEKIEVSDDEKYVMSVGFEDDKDCKHRFKPQNVGFGISYVLPVLIALLTSNANDIVIIENPEAHLHPKGQAAMGNLIARAVASGVQVFVETHSDHVVNGIRSAVKDGIVKPYDVNIAFFERKEHDVPNDDGTSHQEIYSEVRNIRVGRNGALSEYPAGFMDEWNLLQTELIR